MEGIDAGRLQQLIDAHGAALTLYARQWCHTPEESGQNDESERRVASRPDWRYYDEARDDLFKWTHLPYWQAQAWTGDHDFDYLLRVKVGGKGIGPLPGLQSPTSPRGRGDLLEGTPRVRERSRSQPRAFALSKDQT